MGGLFLLAFYSPTPPAFEVRPESWLKGTKSTAQLLF